MADYPQMPTQGLPGLIVPQILVECGQTSGPGVQTQSVLDILKLQLFARQLIPEPWDSFTNTCTEMVRGYVEKVYTAHYNGLPSVKSRVRFVDQYEVQDISREEEIIMNIDDLDMKDGDLSDEDGSDYSDGGDLFGLFSEETSALPSIQPNEHGVIRFEKPPLPVKRVFAPPPSNIFQDAVTPTSQLTQPAQQLNQLSRREKIYLQVYKYISAFLSTVQSLLGGASDTPGPQTQICVCIGSNTKSIDECVLLNLPDRTLHLRTRDQIGEDQFPVHGNNTAQHIFRNFSVNSQILFETRRKQHSRFGFVLSFQNDTPMDHTWWDWKEQTHRQKVGKLLPCIISLQAQLHVSNLDSLIKQQLVHQAGIKGVPVAQLLAEYKNSVQLAKKRGEQACLQAIESSLSVFPLYLHNQPLLYAIRPDVQHTLQHRMKSLVTSLPVTHLYNMIQLHTNQQTSKKRVYSQQRLCFCAEPAVTRPFKTGTTFQVNLAGKVERVMQNTTDDNNNTPIPHSNEDSVCKSPPHKKNKTQQYVHWVQKQWMKTIVK